MSFNGNEGDYYTPDEAGKLTKQYRNARINSINGGFIGKEKLQAILDQDGCMGIRVYLGMDDESLFNFVFLGADAEENDLMGVIVEKVPRCPPTCSSLNPLNS